MRYRPSWHVTWMTTATVVARRSKCYRDRVGAVIVNEHNRIVSTGYNGEPAGYNLTPDGMSIRPWPDCRDWCERAQNGPTEATAKSYEDCPALHAEANALSVCDRSLRENGTIYVTSSICVNCAKLIANSGLANVVTLCRDDDPDASHRDAITGVKLMVRSGLIVQEMTIADVDPK